MPGVGRIILVDQAMTWLLRGHFGPVADGTMLVSAWN